MATPYSDTNSDDHSNALFENLTEGVDFSLPDIDFSSVDFNLSDTADNPLYSAVERIEIDALTTREPCGSGVFDALMEAYSKHIAIEYDKGRITGTEYAKAYVELTANAMSQAVSFLMSKDQAYWNALLVQAQGKRAEVETIQAKVQLEKIKADYRISEVQLERSKADYALTKMQLASEDVRYNILETENETNEYRLTNVLPQELALLNEQLTMAQEQRANVVLDRSKTQYEIDTLLVDQHNQNLKQLDLADNEITKTTKDIEVIDYQLSDILPAELNKMTAQVANITMSTNKTSADRDRVVYDTDFTAPAQRENILADTTVKQYQATQVLPTQVENVESDTLLKEYQRTQILPVQRALQQENVEAKRAETLDLRTDGQSVSGSVGKQKDLYTQQIDSYQRDSESKVLRMMIDTWITQKGIDEGITAPTQLQNASLNSVITRIKQVNNLD